MPLAIQRLAARAMDHLPLAVAVLDPALRLRYWNHHAAGLFGVPSLMMADMPALDEVLRTGGRLTPQQIERIVAFCATIIRGGAANGDWLRVAFNRQHRVAFKLHKLGEDRWLLGIEELVGPGQTAQDGGDAMLDALTGLPNRRSFDDRLTTAVAGGEAAPAVLIVGLDRFQSVNDTHGHAAGDALLCLAAQRLRRELRDDDIVARFGGDAFGILQPNGVGTDSLAARLVDILSRPFLVEGVLVRTGASIGVARLPEHGPSAADLIGHAEQALREAKAAGRGTWRIYDPGTAESVRVRRDLENDLRQALTLGAFSLDYQPRFDLRTRALTGVRALVRWNHPARGVIPPSVFLPLADRAGCLGALWARVIGTACQAAAQWPAHLTVGVSLWPGQMREPEAVMQSIQAGLTISGLTPGRLEIEVTETTIMAAETPWPDLLHRLRGPGVRIVLDRFGTGCASLGYLSAFRFDRIKIDRVLVATRACDPEAAAMIRAIAALGTGLGIDTIAEGVDSEDQASSLLADGCTAIQGYPVTQPVTAEAVSALAARYPGDGVSR
jgi:diguanylate cyclase (GGDEF)-like protein